MHESHMFHRSGANTLLSAAEGGIGDDSDLKTWEKCSQLAKEYLDYKLAGHSTDMYWV